MYTFRLPTFVDVRAETLEVATDKTSAILCAAMEQNPDLREFVINDAEAVEIGAGEEADTLR